MKNVKFEGIMLLIIMLFLPEYMMSQEKGIQELDFLIGVWESREENTETGWWETSTREIRYILKDNYIELKANSIDSNGREREYYWFINYNKRNEQFEMVSMFSNWHRTQFDILEWDGEKRKLTIRNNPGCEKEFTERLGEIVFSEDFKAYTWTGENKYGDPNNPSVWKYVETGFRK